MKATKTYIISQMYKGDFIDTNMGGEIINFFSTDNGENYIYITPWGYINDKYDDTVQAVLLTRNIGDRILEVLGVSIIEKQIAYIHGYNRDLKLENSYNQLQEYEKLHPIKYAGVLLSKIYKGQINGTATFKSKLLLKPRGNKKIYIYRPDKKYEKDKAGVYIELTDKRKAITNYNEPTYIDIINEPISYGNIQKVINNKHLWEVVKDNKVKETKGIFSSKNFIQIIKKEDDESVYSNMFAYFLNTDREMFKCFCKKVLKINNINYRSAIIVREHENIDLYIKDENNIIVIENKLKSGINGVEKRHDFSNNGLIQSQLLKYIKQVNAERKKQKTYFYIFLPNYSKVNIKNYKGSKYYTEIKYSSLYKFFNEYKCKTEFYDQFVKALYKHTLEVERDYYTEMLSKFLDEIMRKK